MFTGRRCGGSPSSTCPPSAIVPLSCGSNPAIARELIVSVNTIRTQVQSIYRKLGVHGRVAASERARALGPEVRAILERTERALRPLPAFDPRTHAATFRLGLDDATQAGMLPHLAAAVVAKAPAIRLVAVATPPAELGAALSPAVAWTRP